jgi:hypothetical protein
MIFELGFMPILIKSAGNKEFFMLLAQSNILTFFI